MVFPTSSAVYASNTAGSEFEVSVVSVNGSSGDDNLFNNIYSSKMGAVSVFPQKFWIITNTNKAVNPMTQKNETNWTLWDENGNVIATRTLMNINQQYTDSFNLSPGCYKFQADDYGCDGIQWWAYQYYNPNPGTGLLRFNLPNSNSTFYSPNGDFGCNIIKYFRVNSTVGIEEYVPATPLFELFPNPADREIFIRTNFSEKQHLTYTISDITGKTLQTGIFSDVMVSQEKINTSELNAGAYILSCKTEDGNSYNQKFIITR